MSQTRITIAGPVEFAASGASQWYNAWAPVLAPRLGRLRSVAIDLSPTQLLDASGVAVLVRLHSHLASRGIRLALRGAKPALRQALHEIGLTDVIPVETLPLAAPATAANIPLRSPVTTELFLPPLSSTNS